MIVLIEEDHAARVLSPAQADVEPVASIDSTRSTARVSAPEDAGEPLEGDVSAGLSTSACRGQLRARRRVRSGA